MALGASTALATSHWKPRPTSTTNTSEQSCFAKDTTIISIPNYPDRAQGRERSNHDYDGRYDSFRQQRRSRRKERFGVSAARWAYGSDQQSAIVSHPAFASPVHRVVLWRPDLDAGTVSILEAASR